MGKKILLIQGHPDDQSFKYALQAAYKKAALAAGAEVQEIFVGKLEFNLNLRYCYRQRTELEPCLIDAQNKIKWSEHIVIFYPVWVYKLFNGAPSDKALKRMTFQFCGISPVSISNFGPTRLSTVNFRQKYLKKVETLGFEKK